MMEVFIGRRVRWDSRYERTTYDGRTPFFILEPEQHRIRLPFLGKRRYLCLLPCGGEEVAEEEAVVYSGEIACSPADDRITAIRFFERRKGRERPVTEQRVPLPLRRFLFATLRRVIYR